jgi:hypothetical protein
MKVFKELLIGSSFMAFIRSSLAALFNISSRVKDPGTAGDSGSETFILSLKKEEEEKMAAVLPNPREEAIDIAIDKTHLKTNRHVIPLVQKKIPDASEKEIRIVNKSRPKDKFPHETSSYFVKIFSPYQGAYQIDLLEQSADRDPEIFPHYFLIAINVNTKYAFAFPAENKKAGTILAIIKKLIKDTKVVSLTADQEGALKSEKIIDFLTEKDISLKYITEQRHSPLALIDSFIRRLRDMNTPTVKGKKTSENPRYRDFTDKRMQKLINIHNNSLLPLLKDTTPALMQNDKKLERQYIIEKIYERERREKLKDFELPVDTKVRYILDRKPLSKHRYKVSPEYYKISGKDGMSYIIMAKDGTTKTISRWKIFPVTNPKVKFGASFENNRGQLHSIDSFNKTTKKYAVTFDMPDGTEFHDNILRSFLRGSNPQIPSLEEIAFTKRRNP